MAEIFDFLLQNNHNAPDLLNIIMGMEMPSTLKLSLISTAFALGTLTTPPAQANNREVDAVTDFLKTPICNYDFTIKSLLSNISQQEPTGIAASSKDWDMEIYQNKEGWSWTLVGKSKAPDANPRKLCILARSYSVPYTAQKWYSEYFPKISDTPKTVNDKSQPQPRAN